MNTPLLRVLLRLAIITLCNSGAAGQSRSTDVELDPEMDAHVQFASNLRLLAFGGLTQGVSFDYQQFYAAAAVGYQWKPILKPHLINIDPDKEHYVVVGGGYEFLRTNQSEKIKDENRMTYEVLLGFRPYGGMLLSDRNRIEFRWINGKYSTTYRNRPALEHDFLLRDFRFTPYGSVELFYDSSKSSWDQRWYSGGIQLPYKRAIMLDTYYRLENCTACKPQNAKIVGMTLNIYISQPK
jgi:hypothetical protein